MSRRVDDVQPDAVVVDRRLLGQDRDPLLTLQVAGVEHAIDELLVGAERPGLTKHRVHERGLAVVDVSHDGEIPEVLASLRLVPPRIRGQLLERLLERRARSQVVGHGPADCATQPVLRPATSP